MSDEKVLGPGALNAHFFDGKLSYYTSFFKDEIERVKVLDEEKKKAFQELTTLLPKYTGVTQNAISSLNVIATTFYSSGRGGGNFDATNNVCACDLLYLIYEHLMEEINHNPEDIDAINKSEYMRLLCSQLDDMASGHSVRAARMLSVLMLSVKEEQKDSPSESVDISKDEHE